MCRSTASVSMVIVIDNLGRHIDKNITIKSTARLS